MTAARGHGSAPRETSGVTTAGLLTYVATHGEPDAVARLLELAGVSETAEELADQSRWFSYATRVRLFSAATEVLGDPDVMFRVGQAALRSGLTHSLELVLRALGSPRQVFRRLPRAVAKFTTVSSLEILDTTATSARTAHHLHEGYEHSALDCDFARGLATAIPELFGLPAGVITAAECRTGNGRTCVYEVRWERRSLLRRRSSSRGEVYRELAALRGQLRTLQSTATELAGSDDLDTVLRRIVAGAGQAVLAPAHLLAVASPHGGAPLVHSAGLSDDETRELARRLLAGEDLGPRAVVVDVASARRRHGRLAAVYPSGEGSMADEQAMLAAYAGHAAAALELLFALDGARREAERAGALLLLAHELAGADDVDAICQVVANALPPVVDSEGASVMLWNPSAGQLQARASADVGKPKQAAFFETPLSPEDSPEVLALLSSREPRIIRGAESSPVVRELLAQVGVVDVVALPLVADGSFLGIATASWTTGVAPAELTDDVLVQLRGVGDQAVSALQRAQLLETVRYQAHHDALTGLPNRVLFLERLLAELGSAGPSAHLGVLFCDLDRFKQVNDALGHAAGDELLRQVAARLRGAIRPGDTVGRLSGDEFAIILPGLVEEADARGLADRVVDCFDEPFRLESREVTVGTSVGVAVHEPGSDAEELLRQADAAMYRHKQGQSSPRPTG